MKGVGRQNQDRSAGTRTPHLAGLCLIEKSANAREERPRVVVCLTWAFPICNILKVRTVTCEVLRSKMRRKPAKRGWRGHSTCSRRDPRGGTDGRKQPGVSDAFVWVWKRPRSEVGGPRTRVQSFLCWRASPSLSLSFPLGAVRR